MPAHLAHDEIIFSLHAYSMATTGHDVNGRLLPLFFQVTGDYWATPVSIYVSALLLKLLPRPRSGAPGAADFHQPHDPVD